MRSAIRTAWILALLAALGAPAQPKPQSAASAKTTGPARAATDPDLDPTRPPRALLRPEPMATVRLDEPQKPLVTFRLVFRAGSIDDPPGKEGLTALTVSLMTDGGTQALSAAELIRALYPMAAELSGGAGKELSVFHGRVHRDHLARFVALFTDVVTTPRFDPHEFARLRDDALNGLKTGLRETDDETLGKVALESVMYGGQHPYRHPELGTVAGLTAITLDDVKAQWKRLFTQDRVVIGLAGAVDAGLETQLKTKLATLPAQGAPLVPVPPAPDSSGKVLLLQKPSLSTAISFGHPYGLRRGDPDYFAVAFALSYLGQHRQQNGLLFRELRGLRGLNYGDYAYAEHFEQESHTTFSQLNLARAQQDFTVWLRPVEPQHAIFAVRGALHFLERLRTAPIPVDEFKRAQGFLLGYSRLWEQTDARRLGYAIDALYDGVPDFLAKLRSAVQDMTPEQVQAAAARQLRPERLAFVLVAPDAPALAEALKSGAPSPITYASPKPPELIAEDKRFEGLVLPLHPGETKVEPASHFMER